MKINNTITSFFNSEYGEDMEQFNKAVKKVSESLITDCIDCMIPLFLSFKNARLSATRYFLHMASMPEEIGLAVKMQNSDTEAKKKEIEESLKLHKEGKLYMSPSELDKIQKERQDLKKIELSIDIAQQYGRFPKFYKDIVEYRRQDEKEKEAHILDTMSYEYSSNIPESYSDCKEDTLIKVLQAICKRCQEKNVPFLAIIRTSIDAVTKYYYVVTAPPVIIEEEFGKLGRIIKTCKAYNIEDTKYTLKKEM